MNRGKDICRELKAVRQRIAEENGIPLEIPVCTYKGECRGTCPRCEAEVRYLEAELEKRVRLGKVATVAGMALGLAACSHNGTLSQDTDDNLVEEEVMSLHENDTNDVPSPPEVETPEGFLPELEGIVHQDDGYRMVPTKDTMEHLKELAIDWEQLYNTNKNTASANPLDEPVIWRGESGPMIPTGTIIRRHRSKILVPQTPMESFKADEEWEARKALPKVVEYDEVDGKKVVKQQNPAEQ